MNESTMFPLHLLKLTDGHLSINNSPPRPLCSRSSTPTKAQHWDQIHKGRQDQDVMGKGRELTSGLKRGTGVAHREHHQGDEVHVGDQRLLGCRPLRAGRWPCGHDTVHLHGPSGEEATDVVMVPHVDLVKVPHTTGEAAVLSR
jgi:hypothetical protein